MNTHYSLVQQMRLLNQKQKVKFLNQLREGFGVVKVPDFDMLEWVLEYPDKALDLAFSVYNEK